MQNFLCDQNSQMFDQVCLVLNWILHEFLTTYIFYYLLSIFYEKLFRTCQKNSSLGNSLIARQNFFRNIKLCGLQHHTQVWVQSNNLIAGFRDFNFYNSSEKIPICLHLLLFSLEISVLMSEISARGCCSQSKFDAEMTTWFEIECF